ncbi:3'(2'),5'-bisphosphate nucleotidase CysQ [Salinimicrobium soli]|uniref:3'(2'),5'-bisphosphate nucleotidase CysQ n=1 Tax=Salinimicrobium soli TaxID=1254399 RepID=UPI003AAB2E67
MKKYLSTAIEASVIAGKAIMKIYGEDDFEIENKEDNSPLTIADKRANEIINNLLIPHDIPIISEENQQISFSERKQWAKCWIVDPLDGTKEFIKRNDEFTVNIALVEEGLPVLGVIYAPALRDLYFSLVSEEKAYKYKIDPEDWDVDHTLEHALEIRPTKPGKGVKVVGSRSHMNDDTLGFIEDLKKVHGNNITIVSKGSSLKFCLLAEGEAHYYPRFAPTMEWDTAAGQAICQAVGVSCKYSDTGARITYNRENLRNGNFCVSYEG